MRNESKILGIQNLKNGEWYKLIYVHSNSTGGLCVNGALSALSLRKAGETPGDGSGFEIILQPDTDVSVERFLAVNSGETMLFLDENNLISVICPGFIGASANVEVRRPIRAGVLTISDKGSRGEREDTAGPALVGMVSAIGAVVEKSDILPDDRNVIAEKLADWSDNEGLHLILTTGGTGLSKRDVTPEALMDVHEKLVPGFGEIMRSHAMLYTTRGFLSRSVAVVRHDALIIAFPGSERAVRQCFEVIAPALRHGVDTLNGWDSECGGR
jgi:molybdenum cofactor synthesis domain-containing protein